MLSLKLVCSTLNMWIMLWFHGFGVSSALGSQIDEVMAKRMKTTPPMSVTKIRIRNCLNLVQHWMPKFSPVRTDIFWAIIRPPSTPIPVHIACPMTPPVITPMRFSRADRMIVVICDRSPHSATNVIVKACMKILNKTVNAPAFAFFMPASGSVILFVSLFTYYRAKREWRRKV